MYMPQNNVKRTVKQNNCTGCGICSGICPQNAIEIKIDKQGFYRPQIDEQKCTNCGICLKICSGIDENVEQVSDKTKSDSVFGKYINCYAGYAKDENIRYNSATGGVIRAIAEYYKNKFDGIITLTENPKDALKPEVKVLKSREDILAMPKSKYFAVEFSKAAEFLKSNSGHYLVIGLPCQIASLKKAQKYLKGTFNSIELFCGAVFSLNFMTEYLKRNGIVKAAEIDFKDKSSGWHNFSLHACACNEMLCPGTTSQKIIKTPCNDDLFYFAQRNKIFTQERCIKCNLCHSGAADIMVGDFWGEKYANDDNGVNLLLARNNTGTALLENCEIIALKKHTIQDVYDSQPWFVKFFKRNTYTPKSLFEKLENKFNPESLYNAIKMNNKMYKLIKKKNLRKAFNRILKHKNKIYAIFILVSFLIPNFIANRRNRILIVPPDFTFGSFGDQAMVFSIIENIKKTNPKAEIALFMMNEYQEKGIPLQFGYNIPIYFPNKIQKRTPFFKKLCSSYGTLYIVGADILDGGCGIKTSLKYFKLMNIAHKKGLKVIANGFSFNDKNYPEIVKNIKKVSQYAVLNARDEISAERLRSIGCKNVKQTADMAFLFDESLYTKSDYCLELSNQILKLKSSGKKVIGLHLTTIPDADYNTFLEKIISAIKPIKELSVIILPHDKRIYLEKMSDMEFGQIIEQKLKDNDIETINAYELENETDVKHIAGLLDFVITSRMHLAIASLSKNVPVISFVYQGKFEGLYKFYNFKQNLMLEADNFTSEDLKEKISYLLGDNSISSMLMECNEVIKEYAKNNLKEI